MSTLDHPAKIAEATAVLGPALCDHGLDAAFAKFPAMWFGVVAAIGVNDFGFLQRPATHAGNRRNRIDEDVMFGTGLRAIRGIRASFSPAPTARTDDESTAAREKSSRPASRNFASKWSLRGNRPNRAKSSGCRVKSRVQ